MIKNKIKELILNSEKIAIVTHCRPDGDAIGSALSLYLAIKSLDKDVSLFCEDAIPLKFNVLDGVENYENECKGLYDLCIFTDCSDVERAGKVGEVLKKSKKLICIDHHKTNNGFANVNYIKKTASTCEIVFEILEFMGLPITMSIASALYTGLMTDTGNFSHSNVNTNCFEVAAKLCELGADINLLSTKIMRIMKKERLKLLSNVLNGIKYFSDGRISVLTVTREMILNANATSDMTEGMIDMAINLEGVKASICILETGDKQYKLSLRSVAGVDVSRAAEFFGGGGHTQAAGLVLNGYYEDVLEKIVRRVELEIE